MITLDQARRVYHAANEPKVLSVLPRAGHNDLFDQGGWTEVRAFLRALKPDAAEVKPAVKAPARAGRPVELAAAADARR